MAYFKFKIDNSNTQSNGAIVDDYLRIIYNCMTGSHTSASTFGTLSNERTSAIVNADSVVVNDAAHRLTKHSGALWSNTTSPTSSTSVYNSKLGPQDAGNVTYMEFYKKHYMNTNIDGASPTNSSFAPYVKIRIGWSASTGWWVGITDSAGANTFPQGNAFSSAGYVGTPTSSLEVGDGTWGNTDTIEMWMGETHFAWATYHYTNGPPSATNINLGSNHFFYWGDLPYIDAIDGYHYDQNTGYYPGVMLNIGMGSHDVRVPNFACGTSDQVEYQIMRYGNVNGIGGYFNQSNAQSHNNYTYSNYGGVSYAQYKRTWPHPLTPVTQTRSEDGTGPLMIPVQYQPVPPQGRSTSTSALTSAGGGNASAQNFGDTRWGPMLNLYNIPDDFGNGPGDRVKVGGDYYRTAWTHKKGGNVNTILNASNLQTNVYALPEKSVVGPDEI